MKRLIPLCALVALALACSAQVALAAPCGSTQAGESEPLSGALLLDESSDLNLDFEKGTGEKRLLMIFEVNGCRLSSAEGITAKPNGGDLPKATFDPATIESDGKFLEVEIPIEAGEFNPGKYTGTVRVSGPTIVPVIQNMALQRSEGPFLPTVIAFVFAIIGLAAAAFMAKYNKGDKEKVKKGRYAIAIVTVAIAVAAVWKGTYADAEIWKPDAVSILVLVLAVAPAAFGAAATALAGKNAVETPKAGQ